MRENTSAAIAERENMDFAQGLLSLIRQHVNVITGDPMAESRTLKSTTAHHDQHVMDGINYRTCAKCKKKRVKYH